MKLRKKVLLIIVLVWIIFTLAIYFGGKLFFINSFLLLENDRMEHDLSRIDQALDQVSNSLLTYTTDWSHWTDLYDYLQEKNPSFVPNNLNMTAFTNAVINFITFWNAKGALRVGTGIDLNKERLVAYPKGLERFIYPGSPLLHTDMAKDKKAYILLPEGIMMVAAVAITDGDRVKKPNGTMITGRFLSPKIIKQIAETTKFKIDLLKPEQIMRDSKLRDFFNNKKAHYTHSINDKEIEGYTLIKDINNKAIGIFRMISPRLIYGIGIKAINYYISIIIFLGIIFVTLMIWLLRSLVIKRLEQLDKNVAEISERKELSRRVVIENNDEISSLGEHMNEMLSIIQNSQEELEVRVQERTKELQKTNLQLQQTNIKLEQEIKERKSIEQELIIHKEHLIHIAHHDVLTNLPNRIYFNDQLDSILKIVAKHKQKLAVFFVDLDRFKNINDSLGHHIGDLVLKEVASRINTVLRTGDMLARLGGDEFILLVRLTKNDTKKRLDIVAKRILNVLSIPITIDRHEFHITASVGICVYPTDGKTLEDLQRNADMAMYKSKNIGGNNFQYFTQEMNLKIHEYIELESALRKAIDKNEFILHFQPQYKITTGTIIGAEALIRWSHPELGLISPSKFIPIAEETGLIMQIGEWVMREACRASKSWQEKGYEPICISINISPKQFRHQDITLLVSQIIKETQLDPSYLDLEITESAVMENVEGAAKKLSALKEMGAKISIDDFGTGYTSINYLKQFPVSILKIDQSFIKNLPKDSDDAAITQAMIVLAQSLGITVIAEGVETHEQLQWLADHNCDTAQGYFLCRPLPEHKFILNLIKIEKGFS